MPTYDLSQPVASGMPTYPGDPDVAVTPHATRAADGYRVSTLELGTHAGTHVDAPAHTEPDGATLDEFPIDAFAFEALRVDCTTKAPREPIRRDDLPTDPDAEALAIHTGWDAHWGDERYRDHPYLAPDAAEWIAGRGWHVAIDAPSVDPTPTERARADEPDGVPAHHALLGSDRLIVENLTNLGAPPDRFALHAYPLPIANADGAPVRAVARTD